MAMVQGQNLPGKDHSHLLLPSFEQTIKQNNRNSIAEIEGYLLSEKTDKALKVFLFSKSQVWLTGTQVSLLSF